MPNMMVEFKRTTADRSPAVLGAALLQEGAQEQKQERVPQPLMYERLLLMLEQALANRGPVEPRISLLEKAPPGSRSIQVRATTAWRETSCRDDDL